MQDQQSKSVYFGLTMTTLVKVRIPFLMNTTWLKNTRVIVFVPHGSWHLVQWQQTCHELHHGCMCTHCHGHNVKKWTSITWMGYVHTYQGLRAIEGCDNLSYILSAMDDALPIS